MRARMNIVWLDEQACLDPETTGGKAAALGRLAATFVIPPGFCVTTTAFDHALADGLLTGPHEPASSGTLAMRASPLFDEVQAAYRRLSARVGVEAAPTAVRSSGV